MEQERCERCGTMVLRWNPSPAFLAAVEQWRWTEEMARAMVRGRSNA
jgi:hypothetical protein